MARLMLIDDDLDLLDAMADFLAQRGHTVRRHADPGRAAEDARSFRPHVVFLDGVLPGITGTAAAAAMRAACSGARIVFFTGLAREALPPGAAFLRKPLVVAELERELARACA